MTGSCRRTTVSEADITADAGGFARPLASRATASRGEAEHLADFGLVHVDFATQRRTPKRSALFYREIIRTRGAALEPTVCS